MSYIGIRSTYEGLNPAKCFRYYDEAFKECRVECKVSQLCKPATARRKAGTPPVSAPPPKPPEMPEPTPAPAPMYYFHEILRGKNKAKFNRELSSDKLTVYDGISSSGVCVYRVVIPKEGETIMVQSRSGKKKFVIDSIEAAEQLLVTL